MTAAARLTVEKLAALIAEGKSSRDIEREYRVGRTWALVTARENGLVWLSTKDRKTKCELRPIPGDFAEVAKRLAGCSLRRHYSASWRTINRWLDEAGIARRRIRPTPDIPSDVFSRDASATIKSVARAYDVGPGVIRRRIKSGEIAPPVVKPVVAVAKLPPNPQCAGRVPLAVPIEINRDVSEAGQAADFLRRDCAVYRCGERGRAEPQGIWWRYGNVILTPDELIARAARKGFVAWRIAA